VATMAPGFGRDRADSANQSDFCDGQTVSNRWAFSFRVQTVSGRILSICSGSLKSRTRNLTRNAIEAYNFWEMDRADQKSFCAYCTCCRMRVPSGARRLLI
jgi:hypothetical protein